MILFFTVKKLTERSDLQIGKIKELLMGATSRRIGPSWVTNREQDQWDAIATERIFAMSSSCDKKEFNPPTKGLTESLATSLIHLAEIHHQIPEENVQATVSRFEFFIKNIKSHYPSFDEFRNSGLFRDFMDDPIDEEQLNSTPLEDEIGDDYTEDELTAKRSRYF